MSNFSETTQPAIRDIPPERRGEQRFPLHLPIVVKTVAPVGIEESAVTLNISARGALFDLKHRVPEGTLIELLLTLPAQITLSEDIHVRCLAKVVRLLEANVRSERRIAVTIEKYDFTR